MDCGMKCVRLLLFIFNFLFWALGIALLVVGIMSRSAAGSWKQLVEDSLVLNAANVLIASGVIVALIGFLGCCGALKKNKCMLISFAICIVLIFILQLAGGIYAYTKSDSLQKDFARGIDRMMDDYGGNTTAKVQFTKAVDWFQTNVKCCGVNGPKEWTAKSESKQIPESCCIKASPGCSSNIKNVYQKGCMDKGKEFVKKQIFKVGGVLIGIGVIQLLGIIFSCCLCRAIDADHGK